MCNLIIYKQVTSLLKVIHSVVKTKLAIDSSGQKFLAVFDYRETYLYSNSSTTANFLFLHFLSKSLENYSYDLCTTRR